MQVRARERVCVCGGGGEGQKAGAIGALCLPSAGVCERASPPRRIIHPPGLSSASEGAATT
jgi:hypothetical protein